MNFYFLILTLLCSFNLFPQTTTDLVDTKPITSIAENDEDGGGTFADFKEMHRLVPFDSKPNKAFNTYMTKIMKRLLPKYDFES